MGSIQGSQLCNTDLLYMCKTSCSISIKPPPYRLLISVYVINQCVFIMNNISFLIPMDNSYLSSYYLIFFYEKSLIYSLSLSLFFLSLLSLSFSLSLCTNNKGRFLVSDPTTTELLCFFYNGDIKSKLLKPHTISSQGF